MADGRRHAQEIIEEEGDGGIIGDMAKEMEEKKRSIDERKRKPDEEKKKSDNKLVKFSTAKRHKMDEVVEKKWKEEKRKDDAAKVKIEKVESGFATNH